MRDGVGRGGVHDEVDRVPEVGGDARGRLAALLGADAADGDLADAALGEELLEVRGGERVVRGLREFRLALRA
nr:hypothetical protein GCM10025732_58060 [Glycomyces mayteni]